MTAAIFVNLTQYDMLDRSRLRAVPGKMLLAFKAYCLTIFINVRMAAPLLNRTGGPTGHSSQIRTRHHDL